MYKKTMLVEFARIIITLLFCIRNLDVSCFTLVLLYFFFFNVVLLYIQHITCMLDVQKRAGCTCNNRTTNMKRQLLCSLQYIARPFFSNKQQFGRSLMHGKWPTAACCFEVCMMLLKLQQLNCPTKPGNRLCADISHTKNK